MIDILHILQIKLAFCPWYCLEFPMLHKLHLCHVSLNDERCICTIYFDPNFIINHHRQWLPIATVPVFVVQHHHHQHHHHHNAPFPSCAPLPSDRPSLPLWLVCVCVCVCVCTCVSMWGVHWSQTIHKPLSPHLHFIYHQSTLLAFSSKIN